MNTVIHKGMDKKLAQQLAKAYSSRPCTIEKDDKIWTVNGGYQNGGGVLAWAYDEEDAKEALIVFTAAGIYTNLSISKFQDN